MSRSPLRFLVVLFITFSWFAGASAHASEEEKICLGVKQYDEKYMSAFLKKCIDTAKKVSAAAAKMATVKPVMAKVSVGQGQAAGLQGQADLAAAGAAPHEERARIAREVSTEMTGAKKDAAKYAKELQAHSKKIPSTPEKDIKTKSALNSFINIGKNVDSGVTTANGYAVESDKIAGSLRTVQNNGQIAANRLSVDGKGAATTESVSPNTTAALVGGALIAGGVVGGLYLVSKSTVKQADKAAEARIVQADKAAEERIKQAEEAASRIIVLARDNANSILANAEATATKIMDKAKQGAEELTKKLIDDIRNEVISLSELGLNKLHDELDKVFKDLIAKAAATGNQTLVDTLSKSRVDTLKYIKDELLRRFGTGTSSSTATGTSTATSSATATATSSATATSTASSTGTATSTVTTTATSTNTTSRTGTLTSTSTSSNTMTVIRAKTSYRTR